MFGSLPGGERMDVLGFVLLILAFAGVIVMMALKGKAWKDFTDRVTGKDD